MKRAASFPCPVCEYGDVTGGVCGFCRADFSHRYTDEDRRGALRSFPDGETRDETGGGA